MNVMDVLSQHPFVIYGAQVVAYGAYCAIAYLSGRKPECFVVSKPENNPTAIQDIPVKTLDSIPTEMFVIVAVTELLQAEIAANLEVHGFQNTFFLTQHEEHRLLSAYFSKLGKFPVALKTALVDETPDLMMYMVKNHQDKPLRNPPVIGNFERTIQAGAAISDKRIAEYFDDTGDNISEKNKQYCEMSALYWIWKNTYHSWTGIEHYRRRLLVTPEMLDNGVDAFLPLPYICYPNTMTQFRRFVGEGVIQVLLQSLRDLHAEEYERYYEILYGPYQYTYNLLCVRRYVFEDYCAWFFEITEHMEAIADAVPEIKETRALSYVAEVLTNLYFMHNKNRWKIMHVEKGIYT